MKLNNKGFAITVLLYSVMILFLLLFASTLKILKTRNDKLTNIEGRVEDNVVLNDCETISSDNTSPYTSMFRGKYIFTINGDTTEYYVYLPRYTTMKVESGSIKFYSNEDDDKTDDVSIYNSTTPLTNVNSFTIKQVCK